MEYELTRSVYGDTSHITMLTLLPSSSFLLSFAGMRRSHTMKAQLALMHFCETGHDDTNRR